MRTVVHDEASVELENRPIENSCTDEEDLIARISKTAVKKMAMSDLLALVEEALYSILRISFNNAQSRILSVVYSVVEQVMLDMTDKNVI